MKFSEDTSNNVNGYLKKKTTSRCMLMAIKLEQIDFLEGKKKRWRTRTIRRALSFGAIHEKFRIQL